ncbi:MAG: hypothetical protein JF614_13270 [Acidobacteria bacterium]|nr:hypothetical protein [Acidobacteriota bacterium]
MRRTLVAITLASSLATFSLPARVAQPAPASLLSRAWSLLTILWGEEGCHIDPNGRCVTAPAPTHAVPALTDTGCNVDPNGRCRS